MPKQGITKQKISITLDKSLVDFLNKECEERTMKLSNYIEKLIRLGVKHEK
jgi:metal-responsive CopG/Arc/MetJ family transcriptional regulator